MAGDVSGGEGQTSQHTHTADEGAASGGLRRLVIRGGRAIPAPAPYRPDAALPAGADVAGPGEADHPAAPQAGQRAKPMLRGREKPREVAVRDLEAERAGRVFPCMRDDHHYTGCVGFDQCKVLCWSPRPREREAVVRVAQRTGGLCRDCVYAREVRGEVATLNGRRVRLMECRLGFWHGRTTITDFVMNKIALNVILPCPGFNETDLPHPAVARMREVARRRSSAARQEKERGHL